MKSVILALAMLVVGILATGCAEIPHQGTSTGYTTAQQPQGVVTAKVLGVRNVMYQLPQQQGGSLSTASLIGGLVGGALGTFAGRNTQNWSNKTAVITIGTTLGGVLGSKVTSTSSGAVPAQEVIVMKTNGEIVAITQSLQDGVKFAVGQSVLIIGAGRIAPASY